MRMLGVKPLHLANGSRVGRDMVHRTRKNDDSQRYGSAHFKDHNRVADLATFSFLTLNGVLAVKQHGGP